MIALAAFVSAWLVMMCLGARSREQVTLWQTFPLRDVLRYLAMVYLLPLLVLALLYEHGMFSSALLTGFSLCVVAGSGTSGAALVSMAGGNSLRAAAILLATTLASIFLMPLILLLLAAGSGLLEAALRAALVCLLFQLLPFLLGRYYLQQRPWWQQHEKTLERLANLAVALLILLVVFQQLPQVLAQPLLLGVGSLLALSFWLGGRLGTVTAQPPAQLELMAIVRNLTGVLVVLPVLPFSAEAMQSIPAFGLPMYVLSALLVWQARRRQSAG